MNTCDLCELDNIELQSLSNGRLGSRYICKRCGTVEISDIIQAVLIDNQIYSKDKFLLSGVTRYRTDYDFPVETILTGNIQKLLDSPFIPRNLSKKSPGFGKAVKIELIYDYPIAFCKNREEFIFLLNHLIKKGLIYTVEISKAYQLTFDGWNRVDELQRKISKKRQAFIAMWFDDEMNNVYENAFRKAVIDCGYEPMRIDLKDHNNKIDDEIMVEIRNSGFMIADFTGNRGGVYFEAGFAKGLGLDVIWTCRKDELDKVHFDTRQFNHIAWETEEELYKSLVNRIKNTITI